MTSSIAQLRHYLLGAPPRAGGSNPRVSFSLKFPFSLINPRFLRHRCTYAAKEVLCLKLKN